VVVANNVIQTRTISSLPIIVEQECRSAPDVHLAQTPCAFGTPGVIGSEPELYLDVLDKLKWANLYFYVNEPELTYPSLPQQQYPITVEELHDATLVGRERIITSNSDVYGWPGSRTLHFCYRYGRTGVPMQPGFVTSVDADGVRTDVRLDERESAVVKWIPMELQCETPVNVIVRRYDAGGCELMLNGSGDATLTIESGDFAIEAGAEYMVTVDGAARKVTADADGVPTINLGLDGQTVVGARPAGG